MLTFGRLKNKLIASVITRFPFLSRRFVESYSPWESDDVPWTPVTQALRSSKIAIVTTSGVHHKSQSPYNMTDSNGDPTYRVINVTKPLTDLMITHDYYDHADADKDINIVFPIERLWEFEKEGLVGQVAEKHYAFMGHIDGPHIRTLMNETAPDVANRLKSENIDVVVLTPG